ncbi:MAG: 3'-5' exonuclease [Opitutaceae bacterium]
MDWTAVPVHMIDFEGCTRSGIVEYGVVTLHRGEIAAIEGRLCASTGPIWSEDTRVHGLRDEELSGLEPFSCEWERFACLRETGVLAAHFAATERRLLRAVWPYPRTSPDFLNTGERRTDWGPWIDTGRLVIGLRPDLARAGLEEVIHALGLFAELEARGRELCPKGRAHFHCALFDALAAALVLRTLGVDGSGQALSLQKMVEESTADGEKREVLRQGRLF